MIKFKSISLRNFQSVGNVTQPVILDTNELILVLGNNLDFQGQEYKNGTGKSTLTQAICFAIFGIPITNIRKDNLVNKINNKDMMVTLDFEIGDVSYRIERGRKPAILRLYVNHNLVEDPENEANGENKHTQEQIDKLFNISHRLYKHIISLSAKTAPFLSLRDGEQREIIEELLGITLLSKKADVLSQTIKEVKDKIKEEEVRLRTIQESNDRIHSHIRDLKFKSQTWNKSKNKRILNLNEDLSSLESVDIDLEIENHSIIKDFVELEREVSNLKKEIKPIERLICDKSISLDNLDNKIEHTNERSCPECHQSLNDENFNEILEKLKLNKNQIEKDIFSLAEELDRKNQKLSSYDEALNSLGKKPDLLYKDISDAYNHQRVVDSIKKDIEQETQKQNPYDDQIASLSDTALQDISYDYLNDLISEREHRDFLYKLLTKKDSFIRKKIIDQNLSFLNNRLNSYLDTMNLPHETIFNSDLSVDIVNHGKEYDFDQLSSGEQNRLILSLSWAFRDIWETFNEPINISIIDELVDSGMDSHGVTKALEILQKFVLERSKNIFLISHKGDLETKVDNILHVEKQNDFTSYRFRDE